MAAAAGADEEEAGAAIEEEEAREEERGEERGGTGVERVEMARSTTSRARGSVEQVVRPLLSAVCVLLRVRWFVRSEAVSCRSSARSGGRFLSPSRA